MESFSIVPHLKGSNYRLTASPCGRLSLPSESLSVSPTPGKSIEPSLLQGLVWLYSSLAELAGSPVFTQNLLTTCRRCSDPGGITATSPCIGNRNAASPLEGPGVGCPTHPIDFGAASSFHFRCGLLPFPVYASQCLFPSCRDGPHTAQNFGSRLLAKLCRGDYLKPPDFVRLTAHPHSSVREPLDSYGSCQSSSGDFSVPAYLARKSSSQFPG